MHQDRANNQLGKIWVLIGTRPEVIKQAPLYLRLRQDFGADRVLLVSTGQHRQLLDQALAQFDLKPDLDLDLMQAGQTLNQLESAVLLKLDKILQLESPELLIVQGDTGSAAMAAWAAFNLKIPVAHNEAGLRSFDLQQPFPEEANRKLISVVANWHFAPTLNAKKNLLDEGVVPAKIYVTGNTGLDALRLTLAKPMPTDVQALLQLANKRSVVLLTAHRRENQGEAIVNWFKALAYFFKMQPQLFLIYPTHPNKLAQDAAQKYLSSCENIKLVDPLDYQSMCHLLLRSLFVITDSGGIQEEGTTLSKPVVICRKTTERPEAVESGWAYLAGTEIDSVMDGIKWAHQKSKTVSYCVEEWKNVFGDGFSSKIISAHLKSILGGQLNSSLAL